MNYEQIVKEKRDSLYLTDEEKKDYNLFLAYVKNGDYGIALYFDRSFVTEEFIEEHIDEIFDSIKYVLPYPLEGSRIVRDRLIQRKNYSLLISLDYKILEEIIDEEVIRELDKIADNNVGQIHLYEYAFVRLLKNKKYDLVPNNYCIRSDNIVDEFYDDLIILLDKVSISSSYLLRKLLLDGDFKHASKVQGSIDVKDLDVIVSKYLNDILELCKDNIVFPFHDSKLLFDYYYSIGDYGKLIQFSSDLLNADFINSHEEEIFNNFDKKYFNQRNRALFDLLYKHGEYEICSLFFIRLNDEEILTIGKHLVKYFKSTNLYYYSNNYNCLKIVCEEGRFDLVPVFNADIIDEEIINKYGELFIGYYDRNNLPYSRNINLLFLFARHGIYEAFSKFSGKLPKEVINSEYFIEFLKSVKGSLPYNIDSSEYVLEKILEIGRYDLLDQHSALFDYCTDAILDKYGERMVEELGFVPHALSRNVKYYSLVLKAKKTDLLDSFYLRSLPEELYADYIDTISEGDTYSSRFLNNSKGLDLLLEKGRFDLITDSFLNTKGVLTDEIIKKHALVLIEKFNGCSIIKCSSYLLRYAIEHGLKDYIRCFSLNAYDDEIIDQYGQDLLNIIALKLEEYDASHISLHRFLSGNKLLTSSKLLNLLLDNNVDVPFNKFNSKVFSDDLIDKYFDLIYNYCSSRIFFLKDNSHFLEKIIELGDYKKFIWRFDGVAFTNEIIDKYFDIFLEIIRDKNYGYCSLNNNSYFLEKVINLGEIDLLLKFSSDAFSEDIVNNNFDLFLGIIKDNNGVVPNSFFNIFFLDKFLKLGLFDYIKQISYISMDEATGHYLIDNFDSILKVIRLDEESPFAKFLFGFREFVNKYLDVCNVEEIKYVNINIFNENGYEVYYPKLVEWIIKYNNGFVPGELICCGNLKRFCKDNNYDKLLIWFAFVDNDVLSIGINIDDIVNEYAPLLDMEPSVLKEKLEFLYSKNDEVFRTLLPLMLKDRMNAISVKHLLTICVYPDLQFALVSLNDNELKLFNKILDVVDMESYDTSNVLYNVLSNLKYYRNIINGQEDLSDEQIENLVYILQRSDNLFDIKSADDLYNDKFYEKIKYIIDEFEKNIDKVYDIYFLKDMLLLKKYGFDYSEARFIVQRYCSDINVVLKSDLDDNLKKILVDLYDIFNCAEIDKLKFLYSTSDLLINDFRSVIYLETYIRSEYAKLYDSTLYKIDEKDSIERHEDLITNPEALDRIRNINYNGVRPRIYYLTEDFNLDIHALGAYSGYTRPENFLDDWNRPKMTSHGVCTSYIGNNQIANARAFHPILGFDSLGDSDLLLAANYDIGSSDANVKFNISREMVTDFLPPDEMINRTRHTHNELVIERMKYVEGVVCKRMPSYVVYLLDDVNNKYNFMTKKDLIEEYKSIGKSDEVINTIESRNNTYFIKDLLKEGFITIEDARNIAAVFYYEEVVQASVDMNVPIVIVDRLLFAKKEKKKCDVIFDSLVSSKDANYISLLLLNYFNNTIGCTDYTGYDYEYYHYFNDNGFEELCVKLLDYIDTISDNKNKLNHLEVLLNAINSEIGKRITEGINSVLNKYVNIINGKIDSLKNGVNDAYDRKGI